MGDDVQRIDWGAAIDTALLNRSSEPNMDPYRFRASNLGHCKRQMFLRKLGLAEVDARGHGAMQVGTLVHRFIEDEVSDHVHHRIMFEHDVEAEDSPITVTGRVDAYDPELHEVYDFKTRSGVYSNWPDNFDPYKERYVDQLHAYMYTLGEMAGKDPATGMLVYVLNANMDTRTYPFTVPRQDPEEYDVVEFQADRWERIKRRAIAVASQVVEHLDDGRVDMDRLRSEGIPFDRCGSDDCWQCRKYEELVPELKQGGEADDE